MQSRSKSQVRAFHLSFVLVVIFIFDFGFYSFLKLSKYVYGG